MTLTAPLSAAVALAVAAAVLALAVWIERLRGARRGRRARVVALALAVLGLLGLCLRPRTARPDAGTATLLTEGSARVGGAAIRDSGWGRAVWRFGDGGAEVAAGGRSVADAATLARRLAPGSRLLVVGHGLAPWELEQLSAVAVELAGAPPVSPGISRVEWRRRLELGEPLAVRGRAAAGGETEGRLELRGPAGVEDATPVAPVEGDFALRALPRATGRFVYRLRLVGDGGEIANEAIEVEVVAAPPLALLWLEASPSFEGSAVKRWLAEQGHSVALRSLVSREIDRVELHNLDATDLNRLTPATLARFDLLVADGRTVAAWGAGERSVVRTAITEEGLGVLLLLRREEASAVASGFAGIAVRNEPVGEEWTVRLRWGDAAPAPALEVAAREIESEADARPLVVDGAGRVHAAAAVRGMGTIGVSLVTESYRWLLGGSPDHHRGLWRRLIGAVARPAAPVPAWHVEPGPAWVDRPVEVTLVTEEALPEARMTDGTGEVVGLALRQEPHAPRRWRTRVWPRRPGWHVLEADEGAVAGFFAQPAGAWKSADQARRQEATRARALAARSPQAGTAPWEWEGLFAGLLLAMLVGALGFLWISDRIRVGP